MIGSFKAHLRLRRLPPRYSAHVFGVMQSGLTTALASAIATFGAVGFSLAALAKWVVAWVIGWATVVPVVIVLAPHLKRLSERLVASHDAHRDMGGGRHT